MHQMAINLVVAIELTFEAAERNCGVGSLPIDILEALAFQGMIILTLSRVLLIKLARELKIQVFFLENWRYLFEASMLSKVEDFGA
jgi:hypothetical protein